MILAVALIEQIFLSLRDMFIVFWKFWGSVVLFHFY